jgi:hypothetical protein
VTDPFEVAGGCVAACNCTPSRCINRVRLKFRVLSRNQARQSCQASAAARWHAAPSPPRPGLPAGPFPALRASGAQVDLRGQGIEAIRRMGLLEAVRGKLVDELGVAFIDATKDYTEYLFDRGVDGFEQDKHRVVAYFSDGSTGEFDLLIAADGQGSRLRPAILPDGADPFWRVGIHMAYWFVPRIASDSNIRDTYMVPGGRHIRNRPGPHRRVVPRPGRPGRRRRPLRLPLQWHGHLRRPGRRLRAGWRDQSAPVRPDYCPGELRDHVAAFVDRIQGAVNPRLLRLGMPMSQAAIDALQAATALACFLHIPDLAARFAKEDRGGGWQLPANPVPIDAA